MENDFFFEQSVRLKNYWIDCFFLYSMIWAFGSVLTCEARRQFNTWLHQVIRQKDEVRAQAEQLKEEEEIVKLISEQKK